MTADKAQQHDVEGDCGCVSPGQVGCLGNGWGRAAEQQGRAEEAVEAAARLTAADAHPLSRELARAASEYASLTDDIEAAGFVARLPLWALVEARWMSTGIVPPEVRRR